MKNLFLLFITAFTATISYAQVPEKSNAIVITIADSTTAVAKIQKVLADKDYTLAPSKNASVISTTAKTLKNGTRVAYNFKVKGNEIILKGNIPVSGQTSPFISYQGKKGTPIMNAWEEMEKLAKLLGGTIKYEIR